MPLISLTELETGTSAKLQQEGHDRTNLLRISLGSTIFAEELLAGLNRWAFAGFTPVFPVHTTPFNHPEPCSDGISRSDLIEYLAYLTPDTSVSDHMRALEAELDGMTLSYNYSEHELTLFVRKTQ